MSKVRIVMNGHGQGRVEIDGVEVKQVRSVEFRSAVDEINSVLIEIGPSEVEVEGVCLVREGE